MKDNLNFIKWCVMAVQCIAIAALSFVCFQSCENEKRLDANEKTYQQEIKILNNKNGTLTASVQAKELTEKELKNTLLKTDKALAESAKRFSKLSSVTQITATAKIDTAAVQFETAIAGTGFERSGDLDKDWFKSNYKVTNTGLQFTNLTAEIGVTSITGFKKTWFFGRQTAMTDVTPAAPGITITQLQSTHVIVPVAFYETKLFLIGTGFLLRSLIPTR